MRAPNAEEIGESVSNTLAEVDIMEEETIKPYSLEKAENAESKSFAEGGETGHVFEQVAGDTEITEEKFETMRLTHEAETAPVFEHEAKRIPEEEIEIKPLAVETAAKRVAGEVSEVHYGIVEKMEANRLVEEEPQVQCGADETEAHRHPGSAEAAELMCLAKQDAEDRCHADEEPEAKRDVDEVEVKRLASRNAKSYSRYQDSV